MSTNQCCEEKEELHPGKAFTQTNLASMIINALVVIIIRSIGDIITVIVVVIISSIDEEKHCTRLPTEKGKKCEVSLRPVFSSLRNLKTRLENVIVSQSLSQTLKYGTFFHENLVSVL